MNADFKHAEVTETIIGAAFKVHNALGFGFLEKVYENAMCVALRKAGVAFHQQHAICVRYEGEVVGDYIADLVVNKTVVVEIKSVKNLDRAHELQLVNYLKATGLEVGLLINFGESVEVRRRVFSNHPSAKSA